ncbi:sensor domain-containing diguanylate cyclase [Pseudoalteromonas sp. 10-33]|uniref:sensor domain-containing diguanylate cyclase n=1 Tax=Pseudoalteromonas sp. 10-33 TaxID=1761890 RepID=UPI003FA7D332
MLNKLFPVLNLRLLIVMLAFSASLATLISSFYSTYQVQKEQLINHTLKSNYAYANKLASATDNFLESAKQQLAYSAKKIEQNINNASLLQEEVTRLNLQTNSFNSVVVNKNGIMNVTSPYLPEIIGKSISSPGSSQALKEKKPLISMPYMSAAKNLIIFISHPLFDKNGNYLGYVGGSLYLKERNILNDLLEQHFYEGGSHIYVVDGNKQILYHPDKKRIGTSVTNNKVINAVITGQSGQVTVLNSKNVEMLAGFAPVTAANWGIVAQRPVKATLASLDTLIMEVFARTLPMALVTFILIGVFSHFISRPLKQLANSVNRLDEANSVDKLKRIKSWYFESQKLKLAMLNGVNILHTQIGQLKHDAQTDPLTNTHNRRSLNGLLSQLMLNNTPFAILEIDIDFFKRVNDTFGHDKGDEALKILADIIKNISRKGDIVSRIGGEEFLLVLPHEDSQSALKIAERLRTTVETTQMETIGFITVSIGIATWPTHSNNIDQVYKCADKALYHAKEHGRNRCVVAEPS